MQRRAAFLAPIPLLAVTDAAGQLAASLVDCKAVPRKAAEDALHIANAAMRQAIDRACRLAGYEPPVICTPEELMNDDQP